MNDLSAQAKRACETPPAGEPWLWPDAEGTPAPSCFQERILAAFWQQADGRVCVAHQAEDAFLSCVVMGSYLHMLMGNVARSHGSSPPTFGPREWLDPAAGQQVALDYINGFSIGCGYGGYAVREKCRNERRMELLGIGKEDSVPCEDLEEPEACHMNTSLRVFIERATPLAG